MVGTLSGGGSACSTPNDPDCYGKFSLDWASGTTAASRLRDWLDAAGTGATVLTGTNPLPAVEIAAAGSSLISENCYPGNGAIDPGETVTVNFSLKNLGTLATSNLVGTLQSSGSILSPSAPLSYGILPPNGTIVSRPFTFTANGTCGGIITASLALQDGTNNLGTFPFSFVLGRASSQLSQNFDGAVAPALPSGWTSLPAGVWVTTTAQVDTSPNAAFTTDPGSVSDQQLVSPMVTVAAPNAQLSFRHNYDTEAGFDGCVLEISIAGGAFVDILTAGGSFLSSGYNGTISSSYGNPLGGRQAWTGSSGGFVTTLVNLPPAAIGQTVQLRWRLGSDVSNSGTGWYVDTILNGYTCCVGAAVPARLSAATYSGGNGFRFTVTGTAGYPYAVESSTDLFSWLRRATNSSPFVYVETNAATSKMHFYRAVFQP